MFGLKLLKSKKGTTLVEIIVALAILGILIVPLLNMFDLSISQIFESGFRTTETMEVQKVVDELQTQQMVSEEDIKTFFGNNYSNYQLASSPTDLTVKKTGKDGNYYIATGGVYGSNGWEVTILKFFKNGTRSTQISTFVPSP